jgi:hypothetical protein
VIITEDGGNECFPHLRDLVDIAITIVAIAVVIAVTTI